MAVPSSRREAAQRNLGAIDRTLFRGPWSRGIGEARKLSDVGRKGVAPSMMNFLTGLNVSTYDTEKWKAIDVADRYRQMGQENPMIREGSFQYIPEQYKGKVDPEAEAKMKRIRQLQDLLAAIKQRRGSAGQQSP